MDQESSRQNADKTPENSDWRGNNSVMDQRDMDELFATNVLARLAVLDDQGWPYVVPVWFEYDRHQGAFWIIPRQKSAWAAYMKRDPRVAITIDSTEPHNRRVIAQGTAELVEEPNVGGEWVAIARRMALRYLGPNGPDYLVPTLDQPRWLFKITPTRLITWQGVDWHPRYRT